LLSGGLGRFLSLVDGSLVHYVGWVRLLAVVFVHLRSRKDLIFNGWVTGPLSRLGESAWGQFWPSGGLGRTLSLVDGSLVHCVGWVIVLGALFGHLGG